MNFKKRAKEISQDIIAFRRYLHQHPELSFQEYETTAFLISELEKLEIPVQSYPDYTGCIAVIRGGKPGGRTVLLRADIDALPIQENSGVPFESLSPGVMHACGHDCHAAMLFGAATLLWECREELYGTVLLLFQAAEECFVGSHYYVDKGHLSEADAAIGVHMWPSIPSGTMAIQDGSLMASCDNFKITVRGMSAHGSTPHLGKDAIVAASGIICNLQTIVSRSNDPRNSLVVTVGTVRAGSQFNIIADSAVMEGTVRAHSQEARGMAEDAMRRIVENTAATFGCTAELEYTYLGAPLINKDIRLNEIAREAVRKLYGPDVLHISEQVMGSEDFAYIMEAIPSSLFVFVGCYDEKEGCIHPVHNEKFKVNDSMLYQGSAFYAQFAADYLGQEAGGEAK